MRTNQLILFPLPAALPATTEDMLAGRLTKANRSLVDLVDDIHVKLWEENLRGYRDLIDPVWNIDAVNGKLDIDDTILAMIVQDYAREHGIYRVAEATLFEIRSAHKRALRRYGLARNQRRPLKGNLLPPTDTPLPEHQSATE